MAQTVVYNGTTIPNIYDQVFYDESYENFVFRCNFFLQETSAAALITAEQNLIDAVRLPFERFQFSFNGEDVYDIDHDANTALNPQAKVSKIQGSTKNTETSRAYQFEYSCGLPADKTGFDFRQRSNFTINTNDARRRTITFTLVYTAGGASSSRTNFDTFAEPYVQGILTSIGGNYEQISKDVGPVDDQDKYTSGKFVFKEILEDDLDGTVNDSRITSVSTTYSAELGQSIGVSLTGNYVLSPLNKVRISYKVKYNKEEVTTSEAAFIYNDEIKPYIINNAFTRLNIDGQTTSSDFFVAEADNYTFNPNDYTFTGSLVMMAPQDRTAIIQFRETLVNNKDDGILPKKVWDQQEDTYALFSMGSTTRFTRTTNIIQIGEEPLEPNKLDQIEGQDFIRLNISRKKYSEQLTAGDLGLNTAAELTQVFYVTFTESYLKVARVANETVIEGPGENFVNDFIG